MNEQTFSDKLREIAIALANGDTPKVDIPASFVEHVLDGKRSASNPTSYIRSTMNRVNEVKAAGKVSVAKVMCNDPESNNFGMPMYSITIKREFSKRVFTKDEVSTIKKMAQRKAVERMLTVSPNLANYAPEEYATVAKVMAEIQSIIKTNYLTEEE